MKMLKRQVLWATSLKCSAGPMNKCYAGHLSDDEMVETPMPGRVRRVIKQRRQQKEVKVSLLGKVPILSQGKYKLPQTVIRFFYLSCGESKSAIKY